MTEALQAAVFEPFLSNRKKRCWVTSEGWKKQWFSLFKVLKLFFWTLPYFFGRLQYCLKSFGFLRCRLGNPMFSLCRNQPSIQSKSIPGSPPQLQDSSDLPLTGFLAAEQQDGGRVKRLGVGSYAQELLEELINCSSGQNMTYHIYILSIYIIYIYVFWFLMLCCPNLFVIYNLQMNGSCSEDFLRFLTVCCLWL